MCWHKTSVLLQLNGFCFILNHILIVINCSSHLLFAFLSCHHLCIIFNFCWFCSVFFFFSCFSSFPSSFFRALCVSWLMSVQRPTPGSVSCVQARRVGAAAVRARPEPLQPLWGFRAKANDHFGWLWINFVWNWWETTSIVDIHSHGNFKK